MRGVVIYISGALSAPTFPQRMKNARRIQRKALDLTAQDYACIVPGWDIALEGTRTLPWVDGSPPILSWCPAPTSSTRYPNGRSDRRRAAPARSRRLGSVASRSCSTTPSYAASPSASGSSAEPRKRRSCPRSDPRER